MKRVTITFLLALGTYLVKAQNLNNKRFTIIDSIKVEQIGNLNMENFLIKCDSIFYHNLNDSPISVSKSQNFSHFQYRFRTNFETNLFNKFNYMRCVKLKVTDISKLYDSTDLYTIGDNSWMYIVETNFKKSDFVAVEKLCKQKPKGMFFGAKDLHDYRYLTRDNSIFIVFATGGHCHEIMEKIEKNGKKLME